MVFPTFFNLTLNFDIRSSCSEPKSAPGLVCADCIELLHLWMDVMGIEAQKQTVPAPSYLILVEGQKLLGRTIISAEIHRRF